MADRQIAPYNELMPVTIRDKMEMSQYLAGSGLMPDGLNSKEKVFVALQMGHELGLSPMVAVNNIAVIKGKPALSASIMDAIVRSHPCYAGMDIESTDDHATVTIRRQAGENIETYTSTFGEKEATAAGLIPADAKSPWTKYKPRMYKHRAMAFAARDAFPDALAGMYTKEEMSEIKHQPRDVNEPVAETPAEEEPPRELTLAEIEATYPDEVIAAIDVLMAGIAELAAKHGDILDPEILSFVENKAREKILRTAYNTPDSSPLKGFEMLQERIAEAVTSAQAVRDTTRSEEEENRERDAQEAHVEAEKVAEAKPTLMDEVKAKADAIATDAEVVEPPTDELDIF